MEKRHYSAGYYAEWKKSPAQPIGFLKKQKVKNQDADQTADQQTEYDSSHQTAVVENGDEIKSDSIRSSGKTECHRPGERSHHLHSSRVPPRYFVATNPTFQSIQSNPDDINWDFWIFWSAAVIILSGSILLFIYVPPARIPILIFWGLLLLAIIFLGIIFSQYKEH